ncbi:DNA polymerase III subunit delta' [Oricola cellulosilytica]|nr:DNA polymerase III subunit delta' [Oricola cellulosilytica]
MSDLEAPETHDSLEGITPPVMTLRVEGHLEERKFLANAVREKQLHHGLIFEGERGVGKATIAFHLANLLLTGDGGSVGHDLPSPDVNASGFRQIVQGSHPGLLYLSRPRNEQKTGYKSAITIDEIRRVQRFFSMTAAQNDAYRVVVIDPVNDLNRNAANALLKLLEEPPARAVFILIAHGTGGLLPTIRSRCQILKFAPLSDVDVGTIVRRQLGNVENAQADRTAALGGGSARRALVFARFGGLELMEALRTYLDTPLPDPRKGHKLAEIAATRGSDIHRDILRELLLERLHAEAMSAARRGNLPAAEAVAGADIAFQERMRLADAFNLDRKQEFLTLLSDIHDILRSARAA